MKEERLHVRRTRSTGVKEVPDKDYLPKEGTYGQKETKEKLRKTRSP